MKILVDADACPVVKQAVRAAQSFGCEIILLCDTNHILTSDYARVVTVGAGRDAVDFELIKLCGRGDVVITQDYGVAAMALTKGAHCLHQSGTQYTDENIDAMLLERHLNRKARNASAKNHIKGPTKRRPEDDERFERMLTALIEKLQ